MRDCRNKLRLINIPRLPAWAWDMYLINKLLDTYCKQHPHISIMKLGTANLQASLDLSEHGGWLEEYTAIALVHLLNRIAQ